MASHSYQVLKGKYELAISSIHELEQERDDVKTQLKKLQDEHAQLDKNTKYLCETILKKEREKKGETPWFKLPLPKMIAEAQTSLENYFPSMEKLYKKLLALNAERTETIAKLNQDIDKMKESHKRELEDQSAYKDKIIDSLKEKLKTGRLDEEEISKVVSSVKTPKAELESIDMDSSSIAFTEEDTDDLDEIIKESAETFHENHEYTAPIKKGPPVKNSSKTKEATKKAVEKASQKQTREAENSAKKLKDSQKLTIRLMGETGFSALPDLINAGTEKFPDLPVKSRITASMQQLTREDKWSPGEWPGKLVEPVKCPVPGSTNFCLYRLSELGRDVYRYLFGKDPVEPEMNAIVKNHSSLEHGYGIKRTAEMLMEAKYVKKLQAEVVYMTRDKKYTVKTGEKTSYIPDIVLVYTGKNGSEYREYYEYETAKCQGTDFFAKCNKIAFFSRAVNIIVPGKDEKEIVLKELEQWKENCLEGEYPFKWERPVEGRVLTYAELKNQNDMNDIRQVEWTKVTISRPRPRKERKA